MRVARWTLLAVAGLALLGLAPAAPAAAATTLSFSTFAGAGDSDFGYDLAVDDSGVYVLTFSYSDDFPATPGAFDTTCENGDAIVSKLDPSGSRLLWSTYVGGSGPECRYGCGLEVDAQSAVYVTGSTGSPDFPTTAGAYDRSFAGSQPGFSDVFVAKLDPTGSSLEYGTYPGGAGTDSGVEIAVDATGAAYVTGMTYSTAFPTTPGAFDTTCADCTDANRDAFVAKLDPTGASLAYSTFLGGSSSMHGDDGSAIRVDAAGAAYVTGTTYSADFPTTPGALDTACVGCGSGFKDGFVTKLAPTGGSLVSSTFLGGDYHDRALDLRVDPTGAAYVTGETRSSDFPTTAGAFDRTLAFGNREDAFVSKLDPSGGSLGYSTYLGGDLEDLGLGVALDERGAATITGRTRAIDFPTTPDAFDPGLNEGDSARSSDAFVTRLDPTGGALEYSTFLGAPGDYCFQRCGTDEGSAAAADSTGRVYVAGSTYSHDFPVTAGAYDTTFNSITDHYADVFVAAFGPPGTTPPPPAPGLTSLALEPASVTGGSPSQGTVTLSGPASDGGVTVALASDEPVATVPASVTVPAGATSASFQVSTAQVSKPTQATISASHDGTTKTAGLTVTPPPDTVTISRADYAKGQLRVEARTTDPDATLRVHVAATDQLIGTLSKSGDKHRGQFSWPSNPQRITVRSTGGGTATTAVTAK